MISHFRLPSPPFFILPHIFFSFFSPHHYFRLGLRAVGKHGGWRRSLFLFFSLLFLLLCFFCCPFIFLQQSLKKTKPHKLIMYPHLPPPSLVRHRLRHRLPAPTRFTYLLLLTCSLHPVLSCPFLLHHVYLIRDILFSFSLFLHNFTIALAVSRVRLYSGKYT